MVGNLVVDLIVGLIACAVVLAFIAWFSHYHDAETIDEEAEEAVAHETREEREAALRQERFTVEDDLSGYSDS